MNRQVYRSEGAQSVANCCLNPVTCQNHCFTDYRLPEKAEFMDYALYPVNGGKNYFERLNYYFGWRFIVMMAVMYTCVKGLLYSMSNQVGSSSRAGKRLMPASHRARLWGGFG